MSILRRYKYKVAYIFGGSYISECGSTVTLITDKKGYPDLSARGVCEHFRGLK